MDRFFLPPDGWKNCALRDDEAHHCRRVMRKQVGDQIEVFDGDGQSAQATIVRIGSTEIELEISEKKSQQSVSPEVELAVGIPKGKTFDLILQKAVELGVSKISPILSQQGNVRISEDDRESKRVKWQRTVLEACKQCGQNNLPEVGPAMELARYLEQVDHNSTKLVAALVPDARPMREILDEEMNRVTVLVGPEGDFSSAEYDSVFAAKFIPVRLGSLILRTETASFYMMSSVNYQFSK